MPHLRLLANDTTRAIAAEAANGSLLDQLLGSLVLSLAEEVQELKEQVSELQQHRQPA